MFIWNPDTSTANCESHKHLKDNLRRVAPYSFTNNEKLRTLVNSLFPPSLPNAKCSSAKFQPNITCQVFGR